ncbi:unnamed protein product [Caenorhabditis bovis]|uniref:G-patch domain-containing protein n=1 Tax=Caenorhabditis bovis TaxID=2654633 RepID=A0A8S1EQV2_9PELO|nr:unnamed protein product [Caenorhabditis bovis]
MYFLYYTPSWVQWILFDVTSICAGIWTNLIAFVWGFALVNFLAKPMMMFVPTRILLETIGKIEVFYNLMWNRKTQIKFTIVITLILSILMFVSRDVVIVKQKIVKIRNLTAENEHLRLVVLSDLHVGGSVYQHQIEKIVQKVLKTNADAVLIIGDMVDGELSDLKERVSPIIEIADKFPTFFVTGNHDYYYGDVREWIDYYRRNNIKVLENDATILKGVCLAGVNDISSGKDGIPDHSMNVSMALRKCSSSNTRIVMAHNPASVKDFAKSDLQTIDLVLSGHTHAGQFYVVIPVVYWLLPYFYGLYDLSPYTQLMVSAGTLYQGPPMKMIGMVYRRSNKLRMSILAEPRRKQRISIDPQNLTWKNDDQKFSKKLMEKMGWSEGDGLGRNRQGNSEAIKLKANYSGKGLGADKMSDYDSTWISHHDDFADLLAALNKSKQLEPSQTEEEKEKTAEKISIELKSKSVRRRIHYQKFTRAKDTTNYTENDKAGIFGFGRLKSDKKKNDAPEEPAKIDNNIAETTDEDKKEATCHTVSTLSVGDYFAAKMAALKAKREAAASENVEVKQEIKEEVIDDEEKARRKAEKKERKRLRREQREKELLESQEKENDDEEKIKEESLDEEIDEAERKRLKKEKKRLKRLHEQQKAKEQEQEELDANIPKKKKKYA